MELNFTVMALHKHNPWWTEKYEISSLCSVGGVSFQARKGYNYSLFL
jgi:hypothetical protein